MNFAPLRRMLRRLRYRRRWGAAATAARRKTDQANVVHDHQASAGGSPAPLRTSRRRLF